MTNRAVVAAACVSSARSAADLGSAAARTAMLARRRGAAATRWDLARRETLLLPQTRAMEVWRAVCMLGSVDEGRCVDQWPGGGNCSDFSAPLLPCCPRRPAHSALPALL